MANSFVGQIEIFGFGIVPRYWAPCNGQIMAISTNQALFALLGTTFGGNGTTTFGLPDLRGRLPIGSDQFQPPPGGSQYPMGTKAGSEGVTIQIQNLPLHTHQVRAAAGSDLSNNSNIPAGNLGLGVATGTDDQGKSTPVVLYVKDAAPAAQLDASAVSMAAGGQPHENRMPLLAINACICLFGVFPSRN
jgi:microcystin-dependent protein